MLEDLMAELKDAMKSGDKLRVEVFRSLKAALDYVKIENNGELKDSDIVNTIQREVKKRKESVLQYDKAGDSSRASKEKEEVEILMTLLPEQMSDQELDSIVKSAISDVSASSIKDMGKVIGVLRPNVAGRVDGSRLSQSVKKYLEEGSK